MAAFAYYRAENTRHAAVKAVKLTPEQVVVLCNALCDANGLPRVSISVKPKASNWSVYRWKGGCTTPTAQWIEISPQMMDVLTVVHEFAHYQDHMARLEQAKGLTWSQSYPIFKRRWHDSIHAAYVTKGVAVATQFLALTPPPATVKEPEVKVEVLAPVPATVDVREAAFAALPESLHCPRCNCSKHKAQFGVRVVKKDAAGAPVKAIRQSYCRDCR